MFGSDLTSVEGVDAAWCTGVDVDEDEDLGWEAFRAGSLGEKAASRADDSFNRMTLLAFVGSLVDRAPEDDEVTFDEGVEEDMMMAWWRKGEGIAWCSRGWARP